MRTLFIILCLLCSDAVGQVAEWNGKYYTRALCNSPNCQMCNSIRAQLIYQSTPSPTPNTTTSTQGQVTQGVRTVTKTRQVPYTYTVKICHGRGRPCTYETRTGYRTETYLSEVGPDLEHVTTLEPMPHKAVAALMKLIKPTRRDIIYDLGCGDGRVLVAAGLRGAWPVGIELNPESVELTEQSIILFGLGKRAKVYQGDILEYNLSNCKLVTMYLHQPLMMKILNKLPRGCKVWSFSHEIPGSTRHDVGEYTFYEWTVP